MPRYKDLTGNRYGRLVVVSYAGVYITPKGQKHATWNCLCDCGKTVVVRASSLSMGDNVSCGCYNKERSTKHGLPRDRLYQIWADMRPRCQNEHSRLYKWYGGKGISVCPEWSNYKVFHDWAYQNGYSDNLTIDRIETDKNYCPENCRWITGSANTKRAAEITIEVDGIVLNLSEWSRKAGMSRNWFARVIKEHGQPRAIEMLKAKMEAAN